MDDIIFHFERPFDTYFCFLNIVYFPVNIFLGRLKQDLILAKQYKLHTVMEKVTKAGLKEAARLKRIIAHMQAEKKGMQALLKHTKQDPLEEREGVLDEMQRMSVTMEGIHPNISSLEQQMSNPIAIREQYQQALHELRQDRDQLERHRSDLHAREMKLREKAAEMVHQGAFVVVLLDCSLGLCFG